MADCRLVFRNLKSYIYKLFCSILDVYLLIAGGKKSHRIFISKHTSYLMAYMYIVGYFYNNTRLVPVRVIMVFKFYLLQTLRIYIWSCTKYMERVFPGVCTSTLSDQCYPCTMDYIGLRYFVIIIMKTLSEFIHNTSPVA